MLIFVTIHDAFHILLLGVRENKSAQKFSNFAQSWCAKISTREIYTNKVGLLLRLGRPSLISCLILQASGEKLLINWLLV